MCCGTHVLWYSCAVVLIRVTKDDCSNEKVTLLRVESESEKLNCFSIAALQSQLKTSPYARKIGKPSA